MIVLDFVEVIKLIVYGIVEGTTEWLPVSSTGHLLILEEIWPLNMSESFITLFRIVIQLAAIIAVIVYFWRDLWPLEMVPAARSKGNSKAKRKLKWDMDILELWIKIIVACIPAAIVGVFLDDFFETHFYNPLSVAIALIVVAILFLIVEKWRANKAPLYRQMGDITYTLAIIIGVFQMLAGVFPGVSRSGACIIGALLIGFSRPLASKFSFYLAIPVMFGASFLKLFRLDAAPSGTEVLSLLIASVMAFITSILTIRFFLSFVKKNKFTGFALYRILLGLLVIALLVI